MRRLCIALIAASLLVAGCGKPEDKFVGAYTGSVELSQETLDQMKAMAAQIGQNPDEWVKDPQSLSMTLELQDEGVFSITSSSTQSQSTTNGKWTLSEDGKSITLSDIELTGDEEEQVARLGLDSSSLERTFTVSEDGRSLSHTDTQMGMTGTVTFTRN